MDAPPRVPLRADVPGRLLRRYKRFLADVELEDGTVETVHCPDPGSMRGFRLEGARVRCSTSEDPRRKLRRSLEMIRVGRIWVGCHPMRANQLVARALADGAVPPLRGYETLEAEVPAGEGSRLDFRLSQPPQQRKAATPPAWVEVKGVTLADPGGRTGRFPDSVTARGRRHMETLARLRARGARAVVLFVALRADVQEVRPADEIDPDYAAALRDAVRAGVEALAVSARVSARALRFERMLPVRL